MELYPEGGDAYRQVSQPLTRRRRPPHPHEQRRRQEWGRVWGQMVSHATKTITKAG